MRIDIGLIGFGRVGRRFARLLDETGPVLLRDHDIECRIAGIATRRHGAVVSPDGIDGTAAAATLDAGHRLEALGRPAADAFEVIRTLSESPASARVVIETTTLDVGEGRPAIDHVTAALRAGCHVVTANKGPAAFAFHELQTLAETESLSFLFEGAVMDGVPVFSLVRETLPAVRIAGFRGVINSTTNYILSALEDGEPFAPALARMQAMGIAEADPSLDVEGWDAAAKAAALANVLLDARITPQDIRRTGIDESCGPRAVNAKRDGRRLRLVASASAGERPVVEPVELPAGDLLAGLRDMSNALVLHTDMLGDIAICQLGGDLTQTAYALLSDLVTVRRRARSPRRGTRGRPPP
jgi:homoserine dehydrogenase